jgi:folate-binding protein YgfZ
MENNKVEKLQEEYQTIRDSAGLLMLTGYSILSATGKDRARFLHGLLSNEIKGLKEGQGCFSAMLNAQGKTLALMEVLCLRDSILLLLGTDSLEKVQAHLRKYIISDQVEIMPMDTAHVLYSLQGPRAMQRIRELFDLPDSFHVFDHFLVCRGALTPRIIISDRSGVGGVDLMVPESQQDELKQILLSNSVGPDIAEVSMEALNLHRIESGIPWFGVDLNENQLPLEAGLKNAISYTKGCYLGQEIIARATYRGHLNRKLCGLILEGTDPAHRGCPLFLGEKEVGIITSSVFSPTLHSGIALAYLRQEVWEPGTRLMMKNADTPLTTKVVELPFIPRQTSIIHSG